MISYISHIGAKINILKSKSITQIETIAKNHRLHINMIMAMVYR